MLISPKHRRIVLRCRDPAKIEAVIPKTKRFTHNGKEFLAVKHGVDECKVLANLGINAPSPIQYYYDWPSRFQPFAHQKQIASFLTLNNRAFNLADLGCGKTLATLWAYDYMRKEGLVNKVLIISPLSTLERTWGDEMFNHFPHLTFAVLHGSRDKRLKLLNTDADVYLINHDGIKVKGIVEALADRADINLIVVDEIAQVGRTAGTDRFGALIKIINRQVPRMCWGLTGTPIPQAPTDAWAQCRLLVPDRVPVFFNKFKNSVMRQVSQFVWVPKPNALDVVQEAMQPAIRFHRDDCIDLPPCIYETRQVDLTDQQTKAYKEMLTKLATEVENGEIMAVNEAVKAMKLLQICCIGHDTPVLTDCGWVPIQDVTVGMKVWDGVEWVSHDGLLYKGVSQVLTCNGVAMTSEHEVLTTLGWKQAKEAIHAKSREELDWAAVRLPNSGSESRYYEGDAGAMRIVVVPVRLRDGGCSAEPVFTNETPEASEKLRVPPRKRNSQNESQPPVWYMGEHETPLHAPDRQRLGSLRRTWDFGVRTMACLLRKLLGRYGFNVQGASIIGPNRQQRTVLAGELPVGDYQRTSGQQADQHLGHDPRWKDDGGTSSRFLRGEARDVLRTDQSLQLDGRRCVSKADSIAVYDLVNCGPRNRFVVQGCSGQLLIVHNCGSAYGIDHDTLQIDATPRLNLVNEVVEDAGTKVIVFVPFKASVQLVADYLRSKKHTVACVYGEVGKHERDEIFSSFMQAADPKVLVAIPQAMSHGLTLTAASTIIWYAPTTSADTYTQANARITRPGQKNTQFIIHIESTELERKFYRRLKDKESTQGVLLDAIRDARLTQEVISG